MYVYIYIHACVCVCVPYSAEIHTYAYIHMYTYNLYIIYSSNYQAYAGISNEMIHVISVVPPLHHRPRAQTGRPLTPMPQI